MNLKLIVGALVLFSCNSEENKSHIQTELIPPKDTLIQKKVEPLQKNKYDANHYKQGIWDIKKNGKLKGFETYKNDTLNGPSKEWIMYPGQIVFGQYVKGLKDGVFKEFENDSELTMVIKYKLGEKIWMGFLGNAGYPKPPKPFGTWADTVFIECPYSNDTIWYKGLFIKNKPVGLHKMYYKNGKPKFEYNYKTEKVKVFDETGKLIKEVKDNYLAGETFRDK